MVDLVKEYYKAMNHPQSDEDCKIIAGLFEKSMEEKGCLDLSFMDESSVELSKKYAKASVMNFLHSFAGVDGYPSASLFEGFEKLESDLKDFSDRLESHRDKFIAFLGGTREHPDQPYSWEISAHTEYMNYIVATVNLLRDLIQIKRCKLCPSQRLRL